MDYQTLSGFHPGSCFDTAGLQQKSSLCEDLDQYISNYLKVQSLDWTRVLPELEVIEATYPAFKGTEDWRYLMVDIARRAVMSGERGIARVILRYLPDAHEVQSRFAMVTGLSTHVLRQRSAEVVVQEGELSFSADRLNAILAFEDNSFLLEQLMYVSLDLATLAVSKRDLEADLPWQQLCANAASKAGKQDFVGICFMTVLGSNSVTTQAKADAARMLEEWVCKKPDTSFCKMYEYIIRGYAAKSGGPSEIN